MNASDACGTRPGWLQGDTTVIELLGPEWIRVDEVAEIFGLSPRLVRRLCATGVIAVRTIEKDWAYLYRLVDLEAVANTPGWLADRARENVTRAGCPDSHATRLPPARSRALTAPGECDTDTRRRIQRPMPQRRNAHVRGQAPDEWIRLGADNQDSDPVWQYRHEPIYVSTCDVALLRFLAAAMANFEHMTPTQVEEFVTSSGQLRADVARGTHTERPDTTLTVGW